LPQPAPGPEDARDPVVMLASPLPPPVGGISSWTVALLASPLAERFSLRVFDTAPREEVAVSGGSRFRLDRASDSLRMLLGLARELRRRRPRVLHVNTSYRWAMLRDGLFVWIARTLGVRTILHFRGGDFPEFAAACPRWARWLLDATLRRTDRLIALTRDTEEFLAGRVPGRVRYLPNFVDLEGFPRVERTASGGLVEILYVGWIIEAKGIRELLQAMQGVPRARLTLVGPSDPDFLASLAPALAALGERVRVLPQLPRAELLPLYREAEIFTLPTWREGFPNVVLEAMRAGLPIVATPIGAIPDAVRHGEEALLVPPRDRDALARALAALVDDPALRAAMGRRARARVEALFSREVVLEQLAQIWQELAAAPR
jgi:glycosyltransferase involved in cell wall biosynthesis